MLKSIVLLILLTFTFGAREDQQEPFDVELNKLNDKPLLPVVSVKNKLIHRGVFSQDLNEFYFTVSDYDYTHFDIMCTRKVDGVWSKPSKSVFNSDYDDHGMSFSPEGNFLYFSSTRPVGDEGVSDTWHIWRSEQRDGQWSVPEYIDIVNLRDKLLSHPTVTTSGELYFHASNLDYSEMDIYYSTQVDGKFQLALKLELPNDKGYNKCTPYVAADGSYLFFATIKDQLIMYMSFRNEDGRWGEAKALRASISTDGQGNPNVTPDGAFLIYTRGMHGDDNKLPEWSLKFVSMDSVLGK
ncbi:PD40 domain-containing protein [Fulvivirga sp. 29W222]|uniref:PD40 domain-containing protein n=1 Tax=Fulvivirga marina TaxID=2494733 RepID=A0A937FW01_9BACT|nr:PD40 domain-containing protein [Fulvivirga marina]MBL6446023.1 PD40 domain-containing protein [Fulvivirga marina]